MTKLTLQHGSDESCFEVGYHDELTIDNGQQQIVLQFYDDGWVYAMRDDGRCFHLLPARSDPGTSPRHWVIQHEDELREASQSGDSLAIDVIVAFGLYVIGEEDSEHLQDAITAYVNHKAGLA